MTTAIAERRTSSAMTNETMMSLVTGGDTSRLAPAEKTQYYLSRCEAAGLDPRTAPLQFIKLQGREILYATKAATDQLAANHGVVLEVVAQATEAGIRTVTVRARTRDGRQTDEIGCVSVEGLKADALCNAYMKAVTKAKRRAILSICGLGMLDETEMETIPGAVPIPIVIPEAPATPPAPVVKQEPIAPTPAPIAAPAPVTIAPIPVQRVTGTATQDNRVNVYIAEVRTTQGKDGTTWYWARLLNVSDGTEFGMATTKQQEIADVALSYAQKGTPVWVHVKAKTTGKGYFLNQIEVENGQ